MAKRSAVEAGWRVTIQARNIMKTRPGICNRKKRYVTRESAEEAAARAPFKLRAYRCELCRQFHLTSRTKGMKTPQHELKGRSGAGGV